MALDLGNTKVQLVVAQEGFEDDELFVPEDVFSEAGAFVDIAANDIVTAHGLRGGEVDPDVAIWRIDTDSLDALVIAGGSGAIPYLWANPQLLDKVREAYARGKIIGAVGLAGVVLAQAGLLKGKRATLSPDSIAIAEYRRHGVNYEDVDVVIDSNIVTARSREDAKMFAELIVGQLSARKAMPAQH
ncbi:MAG TPA: DJ-1/PfpI family protein [Methanocella sp.]|jgi:protease I